MSLRKNHGQWQAIRADLEGWQAGGESQCLLVEILDAVDETRGIDGERDAIQATVAHHTGEAMRVVGLAGGTEDPLHDGLRTHIALLQSILRKERKLLSTTPWLWRVSQHSMEGSGHHQ